VWKKSYFEITLIESIHMDFSTRILLFETILLEENGVVKNQWN